MAQGELIELIFDFRVALHQVDIGLIFLQGHASLLDLMGLNIAGFNSLVFFYFFCLAMCSSIFRRFSTSEDSFGL